MDTTFENVKVGDRVWDFIYGWGTITEDQYYTIRVEFDSPKTMTYRLNGKACIDHPQRLFWDEIKFEIPTKPLPQLEVDTKVLVGEWKGRLKCKRYFSHFDEDGYIQCFSDGTTSFTSGGITTGWSYWELYTGEEK